MYDPNPLSQFSSWMASQFDAWTSMHMLAGGMIAWVLKNFSKVPKAGIIVWTFIIAIVWELFETSDYATVEAMYADYGGRAFWQLNTYIDIAVAVVIAMLVTIQLKRQ